MLVSVILTPALLLGVANAATLAKRWSNGDVATGTTDPNVASGCTYWANSIASSDTCESLNAYFGITIAQLVSWNPSLSSTSCTLTHDDHNQQNYDYDNCCHHNNIYEYYFKTLRFMAWPGHISDCSENQPSEVSS
ncbi:hypothetical protein KXX07_009343, partial [Aspergillus fumigatus]